MIRLTRNRFDKVVRMGVALLDLHFLGMRELRGCESPYDFSSFLTIFSLARGLGRDEKAPDGTVSGTR